MNADRENRIEELVREKMEGKSYSTIREELAASGMSNGEISALIRQVDERVLSETVRPGGQDRAQQWYRIGLILAVIGLVITIAYHAGILLDCLPALVLFSPFIAGILVMFYGRFLKRKQSAPLDPDGTGAIRRRRPYK